MFNTMEVGNRIRAARNRMNKTQMTLADEMGVSYQAVSNWERGNSMPDIGKLPDLCRILNVSLSDLLGEEAETETETVLRLIDHQAVEPEKLSVIAPMVEPGEFTRSVRIARADATKTTESFLPLLPYMEEEDIEALAREALEKAPERLGDIAVFLSEETLTRLAGETEDMAVMEILAPFLSEKALDRYVDKQMEKNDFSLEQIERLLMFLGKGTVRKLAARLQDKTLAGE